jgi:hypothetical protein
MIGRNFFIHLTNDKGYIKIGEGASTFAIDVNNKFKVAWDGDTYLKGSAALYVESGTIYSGTKNGTGNLTAGKYYEFSPSGGRIGPWHIDEKAIWTGSDISSPDSKLGSDGTILLSADSMKLSMTDTEFSVSSEDIDLILNADMFKIGIDTFRYIKLTKGEYGADEFKISGNRSSFSISGSECKIITNNASLEMNTGFTFDFSQGEYNQSTFELHPTNGISYKVLGGGTPFAVSNTGMITCNGIVGGFDNTVSFTYDPGPGFDVLTFSITVSNGIVTNVSAS